MKLLEYQARELFENFHIPTAKAAVVSDISELELIVESAGLVYPLVAKVQIPAGKRGKAGGIKFANDRDQLMSHAQELLHKDMLGYRVEKLMIVEKVDYDSELYLSIMLDRDIKMPVIIFSSEGGMDIEETAKNTPDKISKLPIDPLVGVSDFHARYLLSASGMSQNLHGELDSLLRKLYECFIKKDCLLCEINPLVKKEDNSFVALDGKIQIDESAIHRHPDFLAIRDSQQEHHLVKEARKYRFLYIPINPGERIAVTSNGSGMLMSCIDLLSKHGHDVSVALDLGGGATADRIKEALRILFSTDGVDLVLINIFGGITRCNEIATGISLAWPQIEQGKKLVVRMEGTNKEEGLAILEAIPGEIYSANGLREAVRIVADLETT